MFRQVRTADIARHRLLPAVLRVVTSIPVMNTPTPANGRANRMRQPPPFAEDLLFFPLSFIYAWNNETDYAREQRNIVSFI